MDRVHAQAAVVTGLAVDDELVGAAGEQGDERLLEALIRPHHERSRRL